jgi:hypothetical protein
MGTKKATFDLASLDTVAACNKPIEVEIRSVTGQPTGFFISVLGKDSDAYRTIVRGMADESLKRQAMGKQDAATLDKIEQRNIDALVAVTTGWRFGESQTAPLDGEALEFSAGNVQKLYKRLLPVREQVAEAVNDLENFMKAS